MINIKIIKKIGKIFFVIWATYSLLMIFLILAVDVINVVNGNVVIENLYWYLGLIPSVFAVLYLLSISLFKKSYLLMRIVGLLGLILFLVMALAQFHTSISYQHTLIGLFGLYISINSFIKRRKIEMK